MQEIVGKIERDHHTKLVDMESRKNNPRIKKEGLKIQLKFHRDTENKGRRLRI